MRKHVVVVLSLRHPRRNRVKGVKEFSCCFDSMSLSQA